jgi:uncharacterized protein (DUF1778 family)
MSVESVTISLTEHPRSGPVQMIVRTTTEDKKIINRAARSLEMPQADFLRTAILNVARKVLAQERGGLK